MGGHVAWELRKTEFRIYKAGCDAFTRGLPLSTSGQPGNIQLWEEFGILRSKCIEKQAAAAA